MGEGKEGVKRIDLAEFRDVGFLQELNRQFLHPLGLALEVVTENGETKLGGVWDYRDDPTGMHYGPGVIDPAKAARVQALRLEKSTVRVARLGYAVQPVGDDL